MRLPVPEMKHRGGQLLTSTQSRFKASEQRANNGGAPRVRNGDRSASEFARAPFAVKGERLQEREARSKPRESREAFRL